MFSLDGVLSAVVWPNYVGALDLSGFEPEDLNYQRGQLFWNMENNVIYGRASILVPKGWYTHLVYYHHPTKKLEVGRQMLSLPYDFKCDGVINVEQITKEDFTQLPTPKGYRLPVANMGVR